ncbi:hypothetical protein D3C76_1163120 [compost metagenome]
MVVIGLSASLSSCNLIASNKSAEEQFQLSLSSLASIEKLAFTGEAALRRNDQRMFEQHFTYEGQLTNHDMLTLQMNVPIQSVSTDTINKDQEQKKTGRISTNLRRIQGGWVHTSSLDNGVNHALARYNPFSQLEGIVGVNKSIQEETSASRGTRILRIELKPEDALQWLTKQLSAEMADIRAELNEQSPTYPSDIQTELEATWKQGQEQLQSMLKEADVNTVYHLTIDDNSNIPLRLTSESIMTYLDLEGNEQSETVVNDITFKP